MGQVLHRGATTTQAVLRCTAWSAMSCSAAAAVHLFRLVAGWGHLVGGAPPGTHFHRARSHQNAIATSAQYGGAIAPAHRVYAL